jgi:Short C-terminal domain
MLFLYRPRQTYMPFSMPRNRTQQAAYNGQLQAKFNTTRRLPPPVPSAAPPHDPAAAMEQLEDLRRSGILTDAEFDTAKAKLQAP